MGISSELPFDPRRAMIIRMADLRANFSDKAKLPTNCWQYSKKANGLSAARVGRQGRKVCE